MTETHRYKDGSPWESTAGYSRAARTGNRIVVSGTTAHTDDGSALHPDDTFAQTRTALERAIHAVEELGGTREEVIRTRVFLAPGAQWEEAARAHADLLGDVAPANTTFYVAGLIGEGLLVEVEVEAILPG